MGRAWEVFTQTCLRCFNWNTCYLLLWCLCWSKSMQFSYPTQPLLSIPHMQISLIVRDTTERPYQQTDRSISKLNTLSFETRAQSFIPFHSTKHYIQSILTLHKFTFHWKRVARCHWLASMLTDHVYVYLGYSHMTIYAVSVIFAVYNFVAWTTVRPYMECQ